MVGMPARRFLRTAVAVKLAALGAYALAVRPRLLTWGTTAAERDAAYPGDDLIPGTAQGTLMATTIDAPPAAVWPWLVQMGADRAGFYSWDRLDNGGRPSADRIHDDWQDLTAGGRIAAVPSGKQWFDVALLEPERTLVLRSSLALPAAAWFDPAGPAPRRYSDSLWAFHLRPTADGRTRLIVRGRGRGRPGWFIALGNVAFWEPAHWIMQTRQFAGLRARAGAAAARR